MATQLRVNGAFRAVSLDDDASLLDALRGPLCLTGSKRGCDIGTCGTCTVLVDGIARKSCSVALRSVEGAEVTTIEGLAPEEAPTPLQKAFVAQGAVQCGYCTPGLIMAATGLLRRKPVPSEEDIKRLLCGQLCRCTGYEPIAAAIRAAATAMDPGPCSVSRPDALAKARGTCRYTPDLRRDGCLTARVLRAGRPHARILEIDTSEAASAPGVVRVLTWKDVPGTLCFGNAVADMPALCRDRVRFAGDAVAIVVAESAEAADHALGLVRVTWEDLAAVTDPERALDADSEHVHPSGNLVSHQRLSKGDAASALAASDVVVRGRFETGFVEHACLETEAALAWIEGEDLIVEAPSQNVYFDRREVSRVTGWPKAHVVIRQQPMGAAFGKREDLYCQHHAALATIACGGRPVRIELSREETFLVTTKRHPFRMEYAIGASRDGRIQAIEARLVADTGAYASWAPNILRKALVHGAGAYDVENVHVDAKSVYTNNAYSGAFRGFGAPQVFFAIESLVDDLAAALDMDPVALRRLNALKLGSRTATGQVLAASVGLMRCLESVVARIERPDRGTGRWRRGVGFAIGFYGIGYGNGIPDIGSAVLELDRSGKVVLRISTVDYGQGASALFPKLVVGALGIPAEDLLVVTGDSAQCPDSGSTVASRQTYVSGNAVLAVCAKFRDRLVEAGWPTRSLVELARVDAFHTQARFRAQTSALHPETGQGDAYWPYAFGAQGALVAVDTETGRVRVERLVAAQDVGKALDPVQVDGQIRGAVAMGVGFALLEEYRVVDGMPLDLNFDRYKIPTAADLPDVEVVIVEEPEPTGPHGAKGVGEPPIVPTAPAIRNAIRDAVGVSLQRLPMTPQRVLDAIRTAREAAPGDPCP